MDECESTDRLEEAPARIFVLWHPDYAEGASFAAAIFDWFRTPDGHGLPVYYRSQAAPGDERGLPQDIPLDSDKLNFIIVLAEYRMVCDRAFGGAGARLAGFLSGRLDRAEARLTPASLREAAPQLEALERGFDTFVLPAGAHKPAQALSKLVSCLETLEGQLEQQNGLSRTENARMFITTDTAEAATLIERGLRACIDLERRQAEEQAHPESPSD